MHPLVAALLDSLARKMRVDPSMVRDAVEGRPIPEWFAGALAGAFAPRVKLADFVTEPLPSVANDATIATPMQTQSTREGAITGRKPTAHPFTEALRARGLTVTEWADSHGLENPTVKSWYLGGNAARKIPRSLAVKIERELGVPLSAWTNGIRGEKRSRK